MKRLIIEFVTIPLTFFLLWFTLSRIDFVHYFKVKEKVQVTQKKMGKIITDVYINSERELEDSAVVEPLTKIKDRICEYNQIDGDSIKIRIFRKDEVNAFAIPSNTIIIYTELIKKCNNPEELGCVMAHEIAHIEKNHVMKKFVKELGISIVFNTVGGSKNSDVLKQLLNKTTSTAYDRKLEDEADMVATSYLIKAKINPHHFAEFLNRISEQTDVSSILVYINTHVNSKDRAKKIIDQKINNEFVEEEILSKETWDRVKSSIYN